MYPGEPSGLSGLPTGFFCEDVLLHQLGDDLVLLGDLRVLLGDDFLELGDPRVLGRLGRLGSTALLEIERVGAVLEDGRLPAVDLAGLESVLVTQV